MKQSIEEMEAESVVVMSKMKPLQERLRQLSEALSEGKSKRFIEVNNITLDDVQASEGKGVPYFGELDCFIDWLRKNSNKRFAEWNGGLYYQSDLKDNKFIVTDGYYDDVKKKEKK